MGKGERESKRESERERGKRQVNKYNYKTRGEERVERKKKGNDREVQRRK